MTPDQQERLISAVENVADLLKKLPSTPQPDDDPVETVIAIFTGKTAELETKLKDTNMPRGRKKKEATQDTAAQPTVQQPVAHVIVPEDRNQLIAEWKSASDALREVKAKENALRQALVAQMFDATKLEGTEAVDIGWGYKLRVTKEQNYSATNKNGEVEKLVEELSARGEDAAKLADALIRWQPDVAKKPYREVLRIAQSYNDATILQLLHDAITVKPGMPQLEMVAPGEEQPQESPSTAQPPVYVIEQNFPPE